MASTLTPEMAEILGFLCAEGSHFKGLSNYIEFNKKRGKSYRRIRPQERIEFTNTDLELLERFQRLTEKVYGYKPNLTKGGKAQKIRFTRKHVISNLLNYTDFGCQKWRVPNEINSGPIPQACAFVRGYFLGDGCLSHTQKGDIVRFCSINKQGLNQVSAVLNRLGIEHKMYHYTPPEPRKRIYQLIIRKQEMIYKFCNSIRNAEVAKTLSVPSGKVETVRRYVRCVQQGAR